MAWHELDLIKARIASLETLQHKESGPLGITSGGFHRDQDDEAWYVKYHDSPHHPHMEHLANQIYRALGHNAPHSMVLHRPRDQRPIYFSKKIPGFQTLAELSGPDHHKIYEADIWKRTNPEHARAHLKGLAADVLVHARDLHTNNLGMTGNAPTRIDNGGALLLNAIGHRKDHDALQHEGVFHQVHLDPDTARAVERSGMSHQDLVHPDFLKPQVKKIAAVRKEAGGWHNFVKRHATGMQPELQRETGDVLEHRTHRLLEHALGIQSF